MWYGVIRRWEDFRLVITPAEGTTLPETFDLNTVKVVGKPVANWFIKELHTTYGQYEQEGPFFLMVTFDEPRNVEIEGREYLVAEVAAAQWTCRKKKTWVSWSGDAFYDWHTHAFTVPGER